MHAVLRIILVGAILVFGTNARAQTRPAPPVSRQTSSESRELINNKDYHFIGKVDMDLGDTKIYADDVRFYGDDNRAVLTGNVVMVQAMSRLAADHAEFNTETHLGTFYNAWGTASLQPGRKTRSTPGAPPQAVGLETDVYFIGDKVEKLGPKKYRITNGGFTTCVQPTPRWQLSSSTVVLNIDHYTMLRNAVFSVKGVPMLYTPILYYPTKRDDRATGFLLPTYGTTTLRGQAIHNAFFWAINRSQDATVMHDWYTSAGQGVGAEYRYNFGPGSDGNYSGSWLKEKQLPTDSAGQTDPEAITRSFEIRGSSNQRLPGNFRARTSVNYFSSLQTMQTLNTNIYDSSRNDRSFGGNLVGVVNGFSINGTFDHRETFYPDSTSTIYGNWPRVTVAHNERPLFGTQLYYSVGSEYLGYLRTNVGTDGHQDDLGYTRFDVTPQIRYPFTKWQWFTVSSTVLWRDTYYNRSYALTSTGFPTTTIADDGLNRRFFEFRSQFLGPVFTRIWDTPNKGYAEKFKHTIEPYLSIDRTTAIENAGQIILNDGIDWISGGTTRYDYGLNNRFYAKRRPPANSPLRVSQAREILDISIGQSYYSVAAAAQVDPQYNSSFNGGAQTNPQNFSPIALSVRTLPTDEINATMRAEFDSRYHSLRTISVSGGYTIQNRLSSSVSWNKRAYIAELPGFNDPNTLNQYITTTLNLHTKDNRFGGLFSYYYDLLNQTVLQQRVTGFYNAQCCGLSFEYQTYNLAGTNLAVPVDKRFFMSFTLAGLGNFSPFNGALGGVPR
jgi:LPS-assembly protein